MTNLSSGYRPDIDGLRAVAVLAVVLHHLSAALVPGGYVGVDVFFVISGYLITGIIQRELAEGSFTFKRFYERRVRRIFPALFVMLIVTSAVGYFLLLPSDYVSTLRAALSTVFFSSNVFFWRELVDGYFAPDAKFNPLLHTWSLAVEEQFYIAFPCVLLACNRFLKVGVVRVVAVLALLSFALGVVLIQNKAVAVFFLSPSRAWELLAGALLALKVIPVPRTRLWREVTVGTGVAAILLACFVFDEKTIFPGWAALLPVCGTALVIVGGTETRAAIAGWILQWRPMVYVGLISYSLYLWHWPLIVLTHYYIGLAPLAPHVTWLFFASLLLASISYHLVERPFRRRRGTNGAVEANVFRAAGLVGLCVVLFSVLGLWRNGFESRFAADLVALDKARSQVLPFKACDGRLNMPVCKLGIPDTEVSVLVWGDSFASHLAPVLDTLFKSQKKASVISWNPNCPPFQDARSNGDFFCTKKNEEVFKQLSKTPAITTVVISGYWPRYFPEDAHPLAGAKGHRLDKADLSAVALKSTVQWLLDSGRNVVLVGRLPTYDVSVPQVLALEKVTGQSLLQDATLVAQERKNARFYQALLSLPKSERLVLLDPLHWMCTPECTVIKDGIVLYRDDHHLSVSGAMALEGKHRDGLAPFLRSAGVARPSTNVIGLDR